MNWNLFLKTFSASHLKESSFQLSLFLFHDYIKPGMGRSLILLIMAMKKAVVDSWDLVIKPFLIQIEIYFNPKNKKPCFQDLAELKFLELSWLSGGHYSINLIPPTSSYSWILLYIFIFLQFSNADIRVKKTEGKFFSKVRQRTLSEINFN